MSEHPRWHGPVLPCVACRVCRAWWPWPPFAPLPSTCEHAWPDKYATGDGGRREAMHKGYAEGGTLTPRLFA